MDPALTNFDIFKKKAPEGQPPATARPAPAATSMQTEMRARPMPSPMMPNPAERNGKNLVAAVTVDSSGKVVAVDEQCTPMFGWTGKELIGQHLKVLLREGSETQIASLLKGQMSKDPNNQLLSLRVIARRMDGREFTASLTRLAWTPEAPVKTKSTSLHLQDCWTAVFREIAAGAEPAPMVMAPVEESRSAAPVSGRMEDVPQYQGSPAALRSANEELQKKLEAMAVDAWKKGEALAKVEKERDELAKQMEGHDAELKKARASLEQELERRKRFEAQLHQVTSAKSNLDKQAAEHNRSKEEVTKLYEQARNELSQAKLAAERAEAARQQETARADGFKQALANLQQNYDSLNSRVGTDHHAVADAKRRVEELESVIRGTTAEAERANAELERRLAERSRVEAEWQDQIRSAKAAAERAEATYKQEVTRADRAERELTNVRHAYEEANAKLTSELHAGADAKRRIRELENTVRDNAVELERANAFVQKYNTERNRFGSDWQDQIDNAKEAAERAEAAQKQEAARATRLERDLAGFRERYDELDAKLAAEQRATAEARRRVKEAETQLRDNTAELERVLAEREKHAGRSAIESDLRAQLNAAKAEAERAETILKDKASQFNRLEQEVANLRFERDELQNKCAIEKDAGSKAKRRIKQLEKQLRDTPADGDKRSVRREAELQERIEELEKQLSQTTAELARTKAILQVHGSHRGETSDQLTKELGRLREKEAAHAVELSELERRVRDGVTSLARVTAEVETERSERRRSEERFVALSQQLQQLHSELRKHLDTEKRNQTKVDELEQRVQEWRRDKAA
jgi:PAS domain S-box-containing protein